MESLLGIDLVAFIKVIGLIGVFVIVFAESGLLLGFFLPGDSLLFTAGFLASQGFLHIGALTLGSFLAAVLGDNFGYAFGRRVGPRLFTREKSFLFSPENLMRAKHFYEQHGGKALILARFMPAIRTFAPILAGVGMMHYPTFIIYNLIGAGVWAIGLSLAGYALGSTVPNVDRYIVPIVSTIIIASLLPSFLTILRSREARAKFLSFFGGRRR